MGQGQLHSSTKPSTDLDLLTCHMLLDGLLYSRSKTCPCSPQAYEHTPLKSQDPISNYYVHFDKESNSEQPLQSTSAFCRHSLHEVFWALQRLMLIPFLIPTCSQETVRMHTWSLGKCNRILSKASQSLLSTCQDIHQMQTFQQTSTLPLVSFLKSQGFGIKVFHWPKRSLRQEDTNEENWWTTQLSSHH